MDATEVKFDETKFYDKSDTEAHPQEEMGDQAQVLEQAKVQTREQEQTRADSGMIPFLKPSVSIESRVSDEDDQNGPDRIMVLFYLLLLKS